MGIISDGYKIFFDFSLALRADRFQLKNNCCRHLMHVKRKSRLLCFRRVCSLNPSDSWDPHRRHPPQVPLNSPVFLPVKPGLNIVGTRNSSLVGWLYFQIIFEFIFAGTDSKSRSYSRLISWFSIFILSELPLLQVSFEIQGGDDEFASPPRLWAVC
jgi:hypothetical protein